MSKSDREQIEELMYRYGEACDERDYAALRGYFADDAVVCYSAFSRELRGHDELAAYLKPVLAGLDATQHIFTNFVIDIEGDCATFTCRLHAQHVKDGAPGGSLFTVGGHYKVDLIRANGGWKMTRLTFKPTWTSGNPALIAREPTASAA